MFPTNTKRRKGSNDFSRNDVVVAAGDGGNGCSHLMNVRDKADYNQPVEERDGKNLGHW